MWGKWLRAASMRYHCKQWNHPSEGKQSGMHMQQFAHHCLVIVAETVEAHVSATKPKQKTHLSEDAVFPDDV